MLSTTIYPGSVVVVTFTVAEGDVTPTSASALAPDGTVTDYTDVVNHGGTGVYSFNVECDTEGTWAARFVATGADVGADEIRWTVTPSFFPSS